MRKNFCIGFIVVILCVAIIFNGCQKGQNAQESAGKSSQQKKLEVMPDKLENPNITVLHGTEITSSMIDATQKFEQKYGGKVKYEQIDWASRDQKIIAMMNSGSAPDLFYWTTAAHYPRYMINNILMPLDEYFDFDDPIWNKVVLDQLKFKGKYYGVNFEVNPYLMYYNADLFYNNGLKTPLELHKEGKWNWKTFEEAAIKLTQDLNRDGVIDQWGFSGTQLPAFITTNNTSYIKINPDVSVVSNIKDPKVSESLQFIQDAFYKHKYTSPKNNREIFMNGNIAMTADRPIYVRDMSFRQNAKFAWEFVPFPSNENLKEPVYPGQSAQWGICSASNNPKAAAAWIYIEWLNEVKVGDKELNETFSEEQKKIIEDCKSKMKLDMVDGIGSLKSKINPIVNEVKKGTPVATCIDKNEPLVQEEIDTFNKTLQ